LRVSRARRGSQVFTKAPALVQVAQHRFGEEVLSLAVAGPLKLVMTTRHVIDQVLHPEQCMASSTHRGLSLNGSCKETPKPHRGGFRAGSTQEPKSRTALSFPGDRRGLIAKPMPPWALGPSRILNSFHGKNLKKTCQSSEFRSAEIVAVKITRPKVIQIRLLLEAVWF
jgi:hypothetical protein